jgi:uncharacterized membrane protein YdbT with pleckstrin-like domain
MACGFVLIAGSAGRDFALLWAGLSLVLVVMSLLDLILAFIDRRTTELAVTDRRVIVKTGLIRCDTIEINAGKIESVDIQQPVLGRLLNYGTVTVRGTGIGMNPMARVDDPLGLRAAIARGPWFAS